MKDENVAGWMVGVFSIGCLVSIFFEFYILTGISFIMIFVMIYLVNKFIKENQEDIPKEEINKVLKENTDK